jgi:hypothetical protein
LTGEVASLSRTAVAVSADRSLRRNDLIVVSPPVSTCVVTVRIVRHRHLPWLLMGS